MLTTGQSSATSPQRLVRTGGLTLVLGVVLAAFTAVIFEQLAIVAMLLAGATTLLRTCVGAGLAELDPDDQSRRPLLLRWIDQRSKTA